TEANSASNAPPLSTPAAYRWAWSAPQRTGTTPRCWHQPWTYSKTWADCPRPRASTSTPATTPASRGSCWPSGDSKAPLRTKGCPHRSRPPNVGRSYAPTPGTTTSTSSPDAPNVDRSSPTSTSPSPTPSSWSADSYAGPGSSTAGTTDPAADPDLLAHSLSRQTLRPRTHVGIHRLCADRRQPADRGPRVSASPC